MRISILLVACIFQFSASLPILFGIVNTNKLYEYDAANGTLLNTITVPVYNGSNPVTLIGLTVDSNGIVWMIDKGNSVTAQSFIGYNILTQTFVTGGVFTSQFQISGVVIQGIFISAGAMFMLTRICPGSTCNQYYYSITNWDVSSGIVGFTLLHNSTNTYNSPGWRGLAWQPQKSSVFTSYSSTIYGISFGTGVMNLVSPLSNQPVPYPSAFDSYQFDDTPYPNTQLYYFNQSPDNIYAFNFNANTNTAHATTYPDANGIFFAAYYNGSITPVTSGQITTSPLTSGQITTSPLTSGQITTSPLTTGGVTTGSVSTGSVSTAPLTSGDITTGLPFTTSPLTTSPLTTSPVTTSPITSSELTTSPLTSGDITTAVAFTTSPLTTSPLTSGDITSGRITTQKLTTSPVTTLGLTTDFVTTSAIPNNQKGIPVGTYVGIFVAIGVALSVVIGVLVGIFSSRLQSTRIRAFHPSTEDEDYGQTQSRFFLRRRL